MKNITPSQASVRVLGQAGSFHSQAASLLLPDAELDLIPCRSAAEVLDLSGDEMAVLAVENRILGPIEGHQELLSGRNLRVLHEMWLPLDLVLVGPAGLDAAAVREVVSHPVALAQCSAWFQARPEVRQVPASDTTAALAALNNTQPRAAIASAKAARQRGLPVIDSRVADQAENATRFLLLKNLSPDQQ